jgi:glycosyltransferase involved in cell wall biosynthesis
MPQGCRHPFGAEEIEERAMIAPRISVCIPSYNSATFLPATIESVLCQKFADFELLIIDDCSTDGTAAVAASYAARDKRIRFLANERNLGMVENWNRCIREARGEYVQYVFGDDLLSSPDALGRMAALLDGDSDIALVATSRHYIGPDSRVIKTVSRFPHDLIAEGTAIINLTLFEHQNIIGEPSVVMFRKSLAGRGFDPRYRQIVDMEMWFHLLEQGKFAFIKEPLCSFREHQEQQTRKNLKELAHIDDYVLLYDEYFPKHYITFGPVGKWHLLYYQLYYLWKLSRRGPYDKRLAQEKIARYFGKFGFYLSLPLYKVYNPLIKMVKRRVRTRFLRPQ